MASREAPPPPPPGMGVGPPNSYTPNIPNNTLAPNSTANSMMQNPRFPFNSMVTSAPTTLDSLNSQYNNGSQSSGFNPGGFSVDAARKKRGRPRKYSPDGNIALGLGSTPISSVGHGDSTVASPSSSAKRSRGRPAGSGKKQLDALGSSGVGFTPHVILVKPGEDIASKIMEFSQLGPRTVCILSANGAVRRVTLRQPAMSNGTVTYEGRFEIISLSGSLLLSENNGNHSQTGSLSVSLAGPDGRVLGGGIEGMLEAATSVQVIVGSFLEDRKKIKSGLPSTPSLNFGAAVAAASAPSQGASSESSDENNNGPLNQGGSGFYNNASQPIHGMSMYSNMDWQTPR
ncbi:AT-hook motif nuclear-localized protein 8-like [Cornus florida]|uniref:AT-hook motif nuclear-localized protein 8-like n=1 Tax=Cornus florida TaxID=4283 RepID=UPI00289CB158|nr:AT-hook motif nuclear-localized protein 8-like [Cornus florida]